MSSSLRTVVAVCCLLLTVAGCAGSAPDQLAAGGAGPAPEQLRVEVLSTRAHDPSAFTQGLEVAGGQLYEGTGLTGRSRVTRSDLATGTELASAALPADLFGEGLTVVGDTVWQLTWQDGVALRRDATTLAETGRASYTGEGWGLCHQDGHPGGVLVMSDGTDTLTFRDPTTFAPTGSVSVRLQGAPLTQLNELECVAGAVWANVWQTDRIVQIDPATGTVTAVVDAAGLLDRSQAPGADVLNGIAAVGDRFLITGKLWPTTYEVRFVPVADAP
ncbi:glutaminyl-peptide cyclotransferase [Rhodococcus sp. X156]|uniref:glutaminyl-peptide cyclotransferase n=1 Tax=Rhodococcus sp. X156 TaxID=2499145 RepID=UPI0019D0E0BF|nr:glutaminyl-peptide cyclotransferase [Rhodococcus sp. X156]